MYVVAALQELLITGVGRLEYHGVMVYTAANGEISLVQGTVDEPFLALKEKLLLPVRGRVLMGELMQRSLQ